MHDSGTKPTPSIELTRGLQVTGESGQGVVCVKLLKEGGDEVAMQVGVGEIAVT